MTDKRWKGETMKLEDINLGNTQLPDNVGWDMIKNDPIQYAGQYVIWTKCYIVAYVNYESCDRWIVYTRKPSDESDRWYQFG